MTIDVPRTPPLGTVLARFALPVDPTKAREMALALHSPDPWWKDGPPEELLGIPVVPTFTTSSAHWHDRQEVMTKLAGLDLSRLLHAGQRWDFARPIVVGDRLTATTTLSGDESKQGRHGTMRFATLSTAFSDKHGSVVLTDSSTLVELERMPPHDEGPSRPTKTAISEIARPCADRTFGPITRTDIVRYAGAAGDFNPVHHDEPFAQTLGLPSIFSIGLFQAGLVGAYVAHHIAPRRLSSYTVRFRERVWPDDLLHLTMVRGVGAIDVSLRNDAGAVVLDGRVLEADPA